MDDEATIKEVAARIRKHANNIFIDFYGDEYAERLREAFRDLAHTIEDPSRYDPEPEECIECGNPLGSEVGCGFCS